MIAQVHNFASPLNSTRNQASQFPHLAGVSVVGWLTCFAVGPSTEKRDFFIECSLEPLLQFHIPLPHSRRKRQGRWRFVHGSSQENVPMR
jgi:hypothetical protein